MPEKPAKPTRRPKGSGALRRRGNGWQSSVIDSRTGRTVYRSWPPMTKREAERAHIGWLADLQARRISRDPNISVADYLARWLKIRESDMTAQTFARHKANVTVLAARLGKVKLSLLDPLTLTEEFLELAERYKPSTLKSLRSTATAALNDAVYWEWIAASPMAAVRLPRAPAKLDRPVPTTEQVHALCAGETDELWRVVWEVLAGTGARSGEVLALHWRDIDLKNGSINIGRTLTQNGSHAVLGDTTKTRRGRRIAIDPHLVAVLTAWRKTLRNEELARANPDAPLFPSARSGPPHSESGIVSPRRLAVKFRTEMRRIGADEAITPHAVRHWFISTWMAEGLPAQTIARHCGNSIEQVMSRYGVHAPDHALAEVAARMPTRNKETS